MNTQIVEIQPRELKFIFELKKQSSCSVHLANVTDKYVAFKVKTTSPKKYCVRPNVGIIKPKSTCDFTVTMQAQKSTPSDMNCKDKFLIQSTLVPFGISEDDITPSMFSKDGNKYIEETKLRVVLTSAPNSPVKEPSDVPLEQDASYEKLMPEETHLPVLFPDNGTIKKEDSSHEASMATDKLHNGAENILPPEKLNVIAEEKKDVNPIEESRSLGFMNSIKPVHSQNDNNVYPNRDELSQKLNDAEEGKLKLTKALADMSSKVSILTSKLVEAESTIEKLKQDRNSSVEVTETYKRESTSTRRKSVGDGRIVRAGFPPLFVCMVALICLMVGSLFRA